MMEKIEANGEPGASNRAVDSPNETEAQGKQWPTRAERLGLIQSYQAEALEHTDSHVANLKVIDGDVMLLALQTQQAMERQLIEGTNLGDGRVFRSRADAYLRCVRQIERNARIIWQMSRPGKVDPGSG